MRRGDIWKVDFSVPTGSEAAHRRPAIIVSNDAANMTAARLGRGVVTVVPVTEVFRTRLPIPTQCGLHYVGTTVEERDGAMHTTNVRELKKNPSLALRRAREGPVLILKGNEPDALLIHLDKSLTDTEAGMRPALAASLYNCGSVSLGKAAKISGLSLSEFVEHLGSLGIEIVRHDETTRNETGDISPWLES